MHHENTPHGNDPRQAAWIRQMLKDNPRPDWGVGRTGPIRVDVDVTQEDIDKAGPFKLAAGCLIIGLLGVMALGTLAVIAVVALGLVAGTSDEGSSTSTEWSGPYTCHDEPRFISMSINELGDRPDEADQGEAEVQVSAVVRFADGPDQIMRGTKRGTHLELTGNASSAPASMDSAVGIIDETAGTLDLIVTSDLCRAANLLQD